MGLKNIYGVYAISDEYIIQKKHVCEGFVLESPKVIDLFDQGSHQKIRSLLADIFSKEHAFRQAEMVAITECGTKMVKAASFLLKDGEATLVLQSLEDEDFENQQALMSLMQGQATRIRSLEKEKAKLNRLYEAAVEDMTKLNNSLVTANRQELKQKKRLDRLNKQLNDILGMTAHDIRNALLRIQGFAKLLADDFVDSSMSSDEQGEMLMRIFESGEEGLVLLNDILDISRIESGHLDLSMKPTDVLEFLKRSLANNRTLAERKGLALELDQGFVDGPSELYAEIDQQRLQHVLGNFISNAIKFSSKGSKVTLGCGRREEKDQIEIWVRDQGMGMSEEQLKSFRSGGKIQGREGTSGEKSNGIGLAICKKVIDAHNGIFEVSSKEGEGSCFFIVLNASRGLTESEKDSDANFSKKSSSSQKLRHGEDKGSDLRLGKVLVVDDQKLNLKLVKAVIKKYCQELEVATNPREVLEMGGIWDVVISDQEMPQMKGVELLNSLKKNHRTKCAILLTAHEFVPEDIRELNTKGVDHILSKPLNKDDFIALF